MFCLVLIGLLLPLYVLLQAHHQNDAAVFPRRCVDPPHAHMESCAASGLLLRRSLDGRVYLTATLFSALGLLVIQREPPLAYALDLLCDAAFLATRLA
jgi:hypothetical protein